MSNPTKKCGLVFYPYYLLTKIIRNIPCQDLSSFLEAIFRKISNQRLTMSPLYRIANE